MTSSYSYVRNMHQSCMWPQYYLDLGWPVVRVHTGFRGYRRSRATSYRLCFLWSYLSWWGLGCFSLSQIKNEYSKNKTLKYKLQHLMENKTFFNISVLVQRFSISFFVSFKHKQHTLSKHLLWIYLWKCKKIFGKIPYFKYRTLFHNISSLLFLAFDSKLLVRQLDFLWLVEFRH